MVPIYILFLGVISPYPTVVNVVDAKYIEWIYFDHQSSLNKVMFEVQFFYSSAFETINRIIPFIIDFLQISALFLYI